MEFCPKCSSVIIIKDNKAVCAKCGYKLKKKLKIESSEKINQTEIVPVVSEDAEDSAYPIIDMICPKCKHKKCYFWTRQTRAGDESETKFYKCVKCRHSWRVYR